MFSLPSLLYYSPQYNVFIELFYTPSNFLLWELFSSSTLCLIVHSSDKVNFEQVYLRKAITQL